MWTTGVLLVLMSIPISICLLLLYCRNGMIYDDLYTIQWIGLYTIQWIGLTHPHIPRCFSGSSAISKTDFDSSGNATSPRWGGGTWGRKLVFFFEFRRPKDSIHWNTTNHGWSLIHIYIIYIYYIYNILYNIYYIIYIVFKTITVSGYSMLKEKPIPHFFVDVKSLSSEDSMVQLCHPLPIFEVMAWVRMQVLGCLLAVDFAKKGYRWNMMKCSWLSGESALQNLEFWCPQGFPQGFPQGNSRGTLANVCSTFVVWFPQGFPESSKSISMSMSLKSIYWTGFESLQLIDPLAY